MPMTINGECMGCGACVPACPTNSISENAGDGPAYVIDQSTCVKCEGHADAPQCVAVCPLGSDAIVDAAAA